MVIIKKIIAIITIGAFLTSLVPSSVFALRQPAVPEQDEASAMGLQQDLKTAEQVDEPSPLATPDGPVMYVGTDGEVHVNEELLKDASEEFKAWNERHEEKHQELREGFPDLDRAEREIIAIALAFQGMDAVTDEHLKAFLVAINPNFIHGPPKDLSDPTFLKAIAQYLSDVAPALRHEILDNQGRIKPAIIPQTQGIIEKWDIISQNIQFLKSEGHNLTDFRKTYLRELLQTEDLASIIFTHQDGEQYIQGWDTLTEDQRQYLLYELNARYEFSKEEYLTMVRTIDEFKAFLPQMQHYTPAGTYVIDGTTPSEEERFIQRAQAYLQDIGPANAKIALVLLVGGSGTRLLQPKPDERPQDVEALRDLRERFNITDDEFAKLNKILFPVSPVAGKCTLQIILETIASISPDIPIVLGTSKEIRERFLSFIEEHNNFGFRHIRVVEPSMICNFNSTDNKIVLKEDKTMYAEGPGGGGILEALSQSYVAEREYEKSTIEWLRDLGVEYILNGRGDIPRLSRKVVLASLGALVEQGIGVMPLTNLYPEEYATAHTHTQETKTITHYKDGHFADQDGDILDRDNQKILNTKGQPIKAKSVHVNEEGYLLYNDTEEPVLDQENNKIKGIILHLRKYGSFFQDEDERLTIIEYEERPQALREDIQEHGQRPPSNRAWYWMSLKAAYDLASQGYPLHVRLDKSAKGTNATNQKVHKIEKWPIDVINAQDMGHKAAVYNFDENQMYAPIQYASVVKGEVIPSILRDSREYLQSKGVSVDKASEVEIAELMDPDPTIPPKMAVGERLSISGNIRLYIEGEVNIGNDVTIAGSGKIILKGPITIEDGVIIETEADDVITIEASQDKPIVIRNLTPERVQAAKTFVSDLISLNIFKANREVLREIFQDMAQTYPDETTLQDAISWLYTVSSSELQQLIEEYQAQPRAPPQRGKFFIIYGPPASGKSDATDYARKRIANLKWLPVYASREMRPGEEIGDPFVEYNVTPERKKQLIDKGIVVNEGHVFYPNKAKDPTKFYAVGAPQGIEMLDGGTNLVIHCWIIDEYEMRKQVLGPENTIPLCFYVREDEAKRRLALRNLGLAKQRGVIPETFDEALQRDFGGYDFDFIRSVLGKFSPIDYKDLEGRLEQVEIAVPYIETHRNDPLMFQYIIDNTAPLEDPTPVFAKLLTLIVADRLGAMPEEQKQTPFLSLFGQHIIAKLRQIEEETAEARGVGIGLDGKQYEDTTSEWTQAQLEDSRNRIAQLAGEIGQRPQIIEGRMIDGEGAVTEVQWLLERLIALSNCSDPQFSQNMSAHLLEMPDIARKVAVESGVEASPELLIASMLHDADRFFDGNYVKIDDEPAFGTPVRTNYYKPIQHPRMAADFARPRLEKLGGAPEILNRADALIRNHEIGIREDIARPELFTEEQWQAAKPDLIRDSEILRTADAVSAFTPVLLVNTYRGFKRRDDMPGFVTELRDNLARINDAGQRIVHSLIEERKQEYLALGEDGEAAYNTLADNISEANLAGTATAGEFGVAAGIDETLVMQAAEVLAAEQRATEIVAQQIAAEHADIRAAEATGQLKQITAGQYGLILDPDINRASEIRTELMQMDLGLKFVFITSDVKEAEAIANAYGDAIAIFVNNMAGISTEGLPACRLQGEIEKPSATAAALGTWL